MPAVRSCEAALGLEDIRLGEERRLRSGTRRRYLTCEGGRPLLVQLPTCYTPGGMLSDFCDGARLSLVPLDDGGRVAVADLRRLCVRVADQAVSSGGVSKVQHGVDPETGEVLATASRLRDVRVFESEDLDADDCPVLPGDVVTAIVSPDYFWRSADGERGGVCIRLVQILLHTDRGRYRTCLARSASPSPSEPVRPPAPPPLPRPSPLRRANDNAGRFRPTAIEIAAAKNSLRKVSLHVII
jgi:hypothetical protein